MCDKKLKVVQLKIIIKTKTKIKKLWQMDNKYDEMCFHHLIL